LLLLLYSVRFMSLTIIYFMYCSSVIDYWFLKNCVFSQINWLFIVLIVSNSVLFVSLSLSLSLLRSLSFSLKSYSPLTRWFLDLWFKGDLVHIPHSLTRLHDRRLLLCCYQSSVWASQTIKQFNCISFFFFVLSFNKEPNTITNYHSQLIKLNESVFFCLVLMEGSHFLGDWK
jgi:hypothetical protein